MNENINLVKILKDCPKGTKLYSTTYGEVTFYAINEEEEYPIILHTTNNFWIDVTASGRHVIEYEDSGECTLFPSKDQRDWSKFRLPLKRGDIMMKADGTIPFKSIFLLCRNDSQKD